MLPMKEIRQYISSLGVAEDGRVYIGKLDNKKPCSIGVYNRKADGPPRMAAGGMECTLYDIKRVSLLIHWNKSPVDTEKAAFALFEKLRNTSVPDLGGIHISYLRLMVPEPQDVGTDENGIYEYVIWLDFIYERKC